MTISGKMSPLDIIRRDLDEMGELIEITFSGELARRGENLTAYPDLTISKNRV